MMMTIALITMVAEAAPEPMIPGSFITAFAVAVIGAIAGPVIAWKKASAVEREKKITLGEPVPEIPVKRVYSPPTFSQHMDLHRRVGALEVDVKLIRREQAEQFRTLLEVGEERKDKIFEKIDLMARGFHSRVDQLMDDKRHPHSNKPDGQ